MYKIGTLAKNWLMSKYLLIVKNSNSRSLLLNLKVILRLIFASFQQVLIKVIYLSHNEIFISLLKNVFKAQNVDMISGKISEWIFTKLWNLNK